MDLTTMRARAPLSLRGAFPFMSLRGAAGDVAISNLHKEELKQWT